MSIAVIGDGAMSAGMAYEAMNNAGALDARLIVILNDNDMSIAPPTGAMSAYLARLASGRTYLGLRDIGKKLTSYLGKRADRAITRAVEHARGYVTGGTLFEELGFYHIGPIDGHNLEHLIPVLKNVRDHGDGPVLHPCRHAEGQGLSAGRGGERQISRRQQVRRDHRRAGQAAGQRAGLYEGVRRQPDPGGRLRRQDRRDHRCDAVRHRARSLRRGFSRPHLRRRHRRAACGDLCGRTGERGLQAVRGDLFDLPAARLRPGRPRRGDPETAGPLSDRPRRLRRRRRPDPLRRLRHHLSRDAARLRGDGRGRRGGAAPHGAHRRRL